MARGAPDYGIYQRPGIAEQAVWVDDFEPPVLRWTPGSSVGSPNPVLSQVEQWKGVQSVYFATVLGAGEFSVIQKNLPLIRPGKIGFEQWIRLETLTPGYLMLSFLIADSTNIVEAQLRLDSQAQTASIVTPAGVIPIATNCIPALPIRVWIPVKLVVDTVTDMYDRLFIGSQSIDLSTHALALIGPIADSYITAYLRLEGDAIGAMNAYLDNFILSQNEP